MDSLCGTPHNGSILGSGEDIGSESADPPIDFLVMEYLEGQTLAQQLAATRQKGLPLDRGAIVTIYETRLRIRLTPRKPWRASVGQ